MTHPNAELLRRAYHAFAEGDIAEVRELFADDITWHVPGRSALSGDYHGHEEVFGFLSKSMELSNGSFRIEIEDVFADGDRAIVLCTVAAERYGQSWSSPEVHVWRIANGKGVEFREFQGDQQTEDEFWSS